MYSLSTKWLFISKSLKLNAFGVFKYFFIYRGKNHKNIYFNSVLDIYKYIWFIYILIEFESF